MSNPDELEPKVGGEPPPPGAPDAPRTTLGPVPVAVCEAQTVELPATYVLVVTVRDRIGSPIAGAEVTVTVDGEPQEPRTTDATGLLDAVVFVAPRCLVEVRASFPPPAAGTEPAPGSLWTQPAVRTLDAGRLAATARPFVPGQKPSWPEAEGRAAGAVHLSMRPVCGYSLKHLFPWQNRILRELTYRNVEGGPTDVGRARSGGATDPNDTRDRKQRLRDFIRLYGPKIRGAPSISAFLKESRGDAPPTAELDALYKKVDDARELQRRVLRIDRRMDWLKYAHGHGHWGPYVLGDPGEHPAPDASPEAPTLTPDDPDLAGAPSEEAALEAELPPAAGDVGAGEPGIAPAAPVPSAPVPVPSAPVPAAAAPVPEAPPLTPKAAARAARAAAQAAAQAALNELKALRVRRTSLLKQAMTDKVDIGSILALEVLQLTHRELLAYIQRFIFDKDADGSVVPPWVRYAVIHFSGLRYAGAHHAYYWAEEILGALRRPEIEAGVTEPTSDPQRLAILIEEHIAMLRDEPSLEEGLLSKKEREARAIAIEKKQPIARPAALAGLQGALATLQGGAPEAPPAAQKTSKTPTLAPAEVLRAAVRASSNFWIREMNNEGQRRLAFSAPEEGTQAPPKPPLEEAWGLLVHYRDTGKLPAEAWPAVVQYTELRNDFVNVAAVAFPPPKKPAKKGEPPPPPDPVPPPSGNSKWPVLAPSVEGNPSREYPAAAHLFTNEKRMLAWKLQQAGDLSLVASRAVCNQITEMVAASRGVALKGGIDGDSRVAGAVVESDDNEDDDDNDTAQAVVGRSLLQMDRVLRFAGGLYIPPSAKVIQRGDLMLFMTWRQIGDSPDPSAWVSPFLPGIGYRLSTYNVEDPLPVIPPPPPPPKPKPGEPKRPPPPQPGKQSVFYVTRTGGGSGLDFVDAAGRHVTVLGDGASKVLRGAGARPAAVPIDIPGNRAAVRHAGLDQIALMPTPAGGGAKASHVFVRRHPGSEKYHEVLGWLHIATVIDPPDANGYLTTFETNAPTGVNRRPWSPGWSVVYSRPAGQGSGAPHLAHYLDKTNLLDEVRLPKAEDR